MNPKHPKFIVVYHHPCLDGAVAGAVTYRGLLAANPLASIEMYPTTYKEEPIPLDKLKDVTALYIVDFSYSADVMNAMAAVCPVVILDHHITAQNALGSGVKLHENCRITFDTTKSGAMLAWEMFFPDVPAPAFVLHTQDRDLWQFKLPHTRAVTVFMSAYGRTALSILQLWSELLTLDQGDPNAIVPRGLAMLRYRDNVVADIAHAHAIIQVEVPDADTPYTAAVCPCTTLQSDVGAYLLKIKGVDIAIMYTPDVKYEGTTTLSLRCREGVDVRVIAERHSGGGHTRAAGCRIDSEMWLDMVWEESIDL